MSPEVIQRAYRVRAYPTKQQLRVLAQLIGAKRFVWNWALARKRNAYRERKENICTNQISREFTQLKAQPEFVWLRTLPREPIARLRSATVSRDSAGRYFISFTADKVPARERTPAPIGAVGIDQGVKVLLVTSENERTPVSRALGVKARRLRRYQRSQSRKLKAATVKAGLDPTKPLPKGTKLGKSRRFERNRIRLARLHAQVGDARKDLLHKATSDLIARHALIGIENLCVKGMQRGLPRVRRRVGNACMGEVRRQLKYKAAWAGRRLVLVDRFFPSSQLCSACGWQHKELRLSDRRWQCAACGAEHDRDHNAAKNILAEAQRINAAEAGYREEHGKLRAGSVAGALERTALDPALDTMNRELIARSAKRTSRRQARRDRAKAAVA